jgi:phosphate uptake regulator
MEVRKLQKVGNRSYSLCLPKKWVQSQNLKEKDGVFLEVNRKNELIVKTSEKTSKRPSQISVDISEIDDVPEFMIFCYVRNVDNITVYTGKAEYKKITLVKRMVKYLDGYDITAEDENHIMISFVFKDVNFNLDSIRRRMIYLLSHMIESFEKHDVEALEDIEMNLDRLYHLSKRIILSCVGNMQRKEENNVKADEDLFFLTLLFKKLENIGDSIFSLRDKEISDSDIKDIKQMLQMVMDLFDKKEKSVTVKNELLRLMERHASGSGDARMAIHKIADLCKDIAENVITLSFDLETFRSDHA